MPLNTSNLSLSSDELMSLIPNRAPYLWVDEVVSIDESSIKCKKTVTEDLPVFEGHYPEFPLFPGCLQCESTLQAASILIAAIGAGSADRIPVATRLNNVQFRQMVRPGDVLDISVKIEERVGPAFYCRGRVEREGRITTRLDFVVTEADRPKSDS